MLFEHLAFAAGYVELAAGGKVVAEVVGDGAERTYHYGPHQDKDTHRGAVGGGGRLCHGWSGVICYGTLFGLFAGVEHGFVAPHHLSGLFVVVSSEDCSLDCRPGGAAHPVAVAVEVLVGIGGCDFAACRLVAAYGVGGGEQVMVVVGEGDGVVAVETMTLDTLHPPAAPFVFHGLDGLSLHRFGGDGGDYIVEFIALEGEVVAAAGDVCLRVGPYSVAVERHTLFAVSDVADAAVELVETEVGGSEVGVEGVAAVGVLKLRYSVVEAGDAESLGAGVATGGVGEVDEEEASSCSEEDCRRCDYECCRGFHQVESEGNSIE